MSTRTYGILNRIQTIKPVSHHYCHCPQKKVVLFWVFFFFFFAALSKFHFLKKKKKRGHFYGNAGESKELEDAELLLIL